MRIKKQSIAIEYFRLQRMADLIDFNKGGAFCLVTSLINFFSFEPFEKVCKLSKNNFGAMISLQFYNVQTNKVLSSITPWLQIVSNRCTIRKNDLSILYVYITNYIRKVYFKTPETRHNNHNFLTQKCLNESMECFKSILLVTSQESFYLLLL